MRNKPEKSRDLEEKMNQKKTKVKPKEPEKLEKPGIGERNVFWVKQPVGVDWMFNGSKVSQPID